MTHTLSDGMKGWEPRKPNPPDKRPRKRMRQSAAIKVGAKPPLEVIIDTCRRRPKPPGPHTPRGDRSRKTNRDRELCPVDRKMLDLGPHQRIKGLDMAKISQASEDTITNLNRLRSHKTSRRGAAAAVEATTGLGSKPTNGTPQPTQQDETEGWFTSFLEGYDGEDPAIRLLCNGKPTTGVLDTGAGCNLIGTETLAEVMPDYEPHIRPTTTRARDVRNREVPLRGRIQISLCLGGHTTTEVPMEVVQDQDLLIIGNPLLYQQDLVIVAREGVGTRSAIANYTKSQARKSTYKIYAAETKHLDKDDVTEIRTTTMLPTRTWAGDINKAFMIDPLDSNPDWEIHPALSTMHHDGTMIALVDTRGAALDTVVEKGEYLGTASTDFEEAEKLVTSVMAHMTELQKEIRHVAASQMVQPDDPLHDTDMEIEPPGFELDGPKPGYAERKRMDNNSKYDTERENQGSDPETATLHTQDPEERAKMRKLLIKHRGLFSKSNYDIGHFSVGGEVQKVKLTLSDSTPIVEKYRSLSPAKREAAEQILRELERAKIISRKASQFASQAVWVTKAAPELTPDRAKELNIPFVPGSKDTSAPRNLRFCQDYRLLNARLQSVNWPLPNIKGLLARLKERKVVTLLDASHSFFCIELDEQSKLYTGFQTCERQYVMNRLAMGLKCSSGILNACLARTLAGLETIAFPYSDNIVVASKDEKAHTEDLGRVLKALEDHGWRFKLAKSHIGVRERLRIFGMELDLKRGYMAPDPSKAKALRDTQIPKTRKQLKSFLGGIGYFVETIPDIGAHLAVLHEFTKLPKNPHESTIKWTKEGEEAFNQTLKILQRNNEVALPDWTKEFHLVTDAGPQHVASMLAQINDEDKWVPIGFWTKKLSKAECNLSQVEKEALAVVWGLRQTSYYTTHAKVFIHSDNQPFVLLKKFANQSQKIARWKLFVESFDVTLVWEAAKSAGMSFVDFLSRPPDKKLLNKRIQPDQIAKLPKPTQTGIFDKHQYDKILEDLINKGESTQNGDAAIAKALEQATPTTNGKATTKEQWNARARLVAATANQRFGLGTPSRATAVGRNPTNKEEALLEVILNESPHLNLEQLANLQKQCSALGPIRRNIDGYPRFRIHQDILIRETAHQAIKRLQLAIPVTIADDLVGDLHRGATTCHAGKKKLMKMIATRFYIPQLAKRVEKTVDNCGICGYYKSRKTGGARPDAKRMTADGPGQIWAVDHIQIVSTPDDKNRTSVLCFVDLYSHYTVCKAVPKTITAEEAADTFLEEVVAKFGICKAILSDNGPDMDNDLIREMCNLLGIRKLTISPGSPKSNGIVEKVQGLILNSIKLQGAQYKVRPDRFADLLVWATLCHNATPYQNIQPPLSPAEIFLGRSIPEATFFAFNNAQYACENLEKFNKRMVAAQATVAEIIGARERFLKDMEIKKKVIQAKDWQYPPGTIVAIKDKTQARKETNVKLRPKYKGAFIVVKETATSCMVRPYSSETIMKDMEDDLDATKGRGRKLPRYKIIKADKGDLKKIKHLLFYSMPLARKFAEHLNSPDPDPGRTYLVTEGDETREATAEEELLEEVEEPDADETANPANTTGKRKADQALESSAKRLARISTQPTFDFEEGCDEYR